MPAAIAAEVSETEKIDSRAAVRKSCESVGMMHFDFWVNDVWTCFEVD